MRQLNEVEIKTVSGADIGVDVLMGMWNDAGLNTDYFFNYERASKSINAIGLASATENKSWINSKMGEAGWMLNDAGEKVTWFNNGIFFAFQFG